MNKIIPLIIFFISIFVYADKSKEKEKLPIITEIAFEKGDFYNKAVPPVELIIAIEISNSADYKISYENEIINAGIFNKGSNLISIGSKKLFEKSGTHIFILETKVGQFKFDYEISIDIKLDNLFQKKISIVRDKPFQYNVDMYIEGQLISKSRKKIFIGIPDNIKRSIEKAVESDPIPPVNVENSSTLFSIPLKEVLKLFKKKKAKYSHIPRDRIVFIEFWKKDKTGVLVKVKVQLKINSRILKHENFDKELTLDILNL